MDEWAGLALTRVSDEGTAALWRSAHNEIIPTHTLTVEEVLDRSGRHLLEIATVDQQLVGCSTVRPATEEEPLTIIVRVLPELRRRGLGGAMLARSLPHAHDAGVGVVQTIVLASNIDGLEFAVRRGFVERDRYTLEGDTVPYIHLAVALADLGSS